METVVSMPRVRVTGIPTFPAFSTPFFLLPAVLVVGYYRHDTVCSTQLVEAALQVMYYTHTGSGRMKGMPMFSAARQWIKHLAGRCHLEKRQRGRLQEATTWNAEQQYEKRKRRGQLAAFPPAS
eukprot:364354-Chlamydomonas_euryale.AAC.11